MFTQLIFNIDSLLIENSKILRIRLVISVNIKKRQFETYDSLIFVA